MKNPILLTTLALIAIGGTALPNIALAQDDQEQEQAASAHENRNEMICTMERQTGSRIRVRVCRTQAEIDREREEARDFINRTRERTAQNDRRSN